MKALCWLNLGCRGDVIREEWIERGGAGRHTHLVRFYECRYCQETWATITSPDPRESRYSRPDKFSIGPEVIA
jgi:hypothetical protein